MIKTETDYFTRTEARRLAHTIEAYWHGRGHHSVKVQAYPLEGFESHLYGVKSDLINGLPAK